MISPTWTDDSLSFYSPPESKLFANPIAIAACAADAMASTVHKPIQLLFWCAGTWGHSYPLSGNVVDDDSPPRTTSLLTFRALNALHRPNPPQTNSGNSPVCRTMIEQILQKNKYKP